MNKNNKPMPGIQNEKGWYLFSTLVVARALMMAVEKQLETTVFEALQSPQKRMEDKALKVFSWPCRT